MMTDEALYRNIYMDLLRLYPVACRRKWHSDETKTFNANYLYELDKLARALVGHYYKPQPGYRFPIFESSPREIFASHFRDRVMHHLFFEYVNPIVEPTFIKNSFACRKGKGVLVGIKTLYRDIWSCSDQGRKTTYVLKCDLSAYFMNINRQKLRSLVYTKLTHYRYVGKKARYSYRKDIALYLLDLFALRDPLVGSEKRGLQSDWERVPIRKTLEGAPEGCGLPIGNLTSQLFSNIYMNEFDQWIKRIKKQRYYGRYVDDFYVVSTDRVALEALLLEAGQWLKTELGVTLNPKKCHIYKVSDKGEGVHFLGARIWLHHIFASRRTIRGYFQSTTPESINSYLGTLRQFATTLFRRRTISGKYALCGFTVGEPLRGV